MSNKIQRYNENFLGVQQQNKNIDSTRKHQKKQIFGEIKNVIHNQAITTPLKPEQLGNKGVSSKYFPCANIRNKQPVHSEVKPINNSALTKSYNDFDDLNLLDYFDFRGQCCSNGQKNDQQIWAEMNLYDDSFINKILDVEQLHQVEESNYKDPNLKQNEEDSELFNDIKDDSNYHYWPATEDFQEESDIHLLLEKPLAIDFDF